MSAGAFTPGFAGFPLRELTGIEENGVSHSGTAAAIELLDRLVEGTNGAAEGRRAKHWTPSERDRALLEVLRLTWGLQIESTITCSTCSAPFDLSFSADELMPRADRSAAMSQPDGTLQTPDGGHFRLPVGEDEMAVAAIAPEDAASALRERCVIAEGTGGLAAIEQAMESLAPILDRDVRAVCPECSNEQAVRFDLQYYVLQMLIQEQPRLVLDIHCIASVYGWSLTEILGLRRSLRRRLVGLIEESGGRRV
jgi:hypothetical protein